SQAMSRPRLAPLAAAFVLLVACSDDSAQGATETGTATTSGTTDASTGDLPTTGVPPTTTTAGPEPTTTTGDAIVEVEYARGLRLTRATVNQGVQVEVVHDGVEVAAGELGARLLRGRKAV